MVDLCLDADDLCESQDVVEIGAVAHVIAALRPAVVLEIGAYTGASLRVWAQVAAPDALLIAVDTEPGRILPFTQVGQAGLILAGESLADQTHEHLLAGLSAIRPGAAIDFLFIDGDHSLALADFDLYAPLVRSGGIVGFHDILHDAFPTATDWVALKARFGDAATEYVNPLRDRSVAMGIGLIRLP